MDDATLWHRVATGALTLCAGVFGWAWKEHSAKVKYLDRKLTGVPIGQDGRAACSAVHKDFLDKVELGFQRIYDKLDERKTHFEQQFDKVGAQIEEVRKESSDKYEKLRDLIDERTK